LIAGIDLGFGTWQQNMIVDFLPDAIPASDSDMADQMKTAYWLS
jgi:hypothetical protein